MTPRGVGAGKPGPAGPGRRSPWRDPAGDSGTGWIAGGVAVMAAAVALGACAGGAPTVCPAIGWTNAVIVELADDWPPVEGGSLTVDCAPMCGWAVVEDAPLAEQDHLAVPLEGPTAVVQLDMSAPDAVSIRVLGPDKTELADVDTDLDWRRVGGSEQCGGPMEATVVVPAP
ncbi:hypothetical protein [Blastococcus tunisiensis]|uniref:Uncharacterized protein n=1 Tax=Blastococcus tunisiensis TaxID=1798228 RepID=A0A1I2HQ56_9ACTN|nr:hypothetical protein [Blastococcus sp. DSM 46838]SFF32234.1 hypothetical protein SAMN05216574_111134 [Blastococcus sp. DSM 46838]